MFGGPRSLPVLCPSCRLRHATIRSLNETSCGRHWPFPGFHRKPVNANRPNAITGSVSRQGIYLRHKRRHFHDGGQASQRIQASKPASGRRVEDDDASDESAKPAVGRFGALWRCSPGSPTSTSSCSARCSRRVIGAGAYATRDPHGLFEVDDGRHGLASRVPASAMSRGPTCRSALQACRTTIR